LLLLPDAVNIIYMPLSHITPVLPMLLAVLYQTCTRVPHLSRVLQLCPPCRAAAKPNSSKKKKDKKDMSSLFAALEEDTAAAGGCECLGPARG
jgi:hypothetical protein